MNLGSRLARLEKALAEQDEHDRDSRRAWAHSFYIWLVDNNAPDEREAFVRVLRGEAQPGDVETANKIWQGAPAVLKERPRADPSRLPPLSEHARYIVGWAAWFKGRAGRQE